MTVDAGLQTTLKKIKIKLINIVFFFFFLSCSLASLVCHACLCSAYLFSFLFKDETGLFSFVNYLYIHVIAWRSKIVLQNISDLDGRAWLSHVKSIIYIYIRSPTESLLFVILIKFDVTNVEIICTQKMFVSIYNKHTALIFFACLGTKT